MGDNHGGRAMRRGKTRGRAAWARTRDAL